MPQLLAHLVGDYVLQNHWMANNKTRAWLPAVIHALLYTSVFLLLTPDPGVLAVIGGTHLVIDRFRLARYWVEFWGVGVEGKVVPAVRRVLGVHGQPVDAAPPFLGVWLLILVDNTLHLTINYWALTYIAK